MYIILSLIWIGIIIRILININNKNYKKEILYHEDTIKNMDLEFQQYGQILYEKLELAEINWESLDDKIRPIYQNLCRYYPIKSFNICKLIIFSYIIENQFNLERNL